MNPARPTDHFAAVPTAWEEWQRGFTPTARAVYVQLLLSMHRGTGVVRASLSDLSKASGLSRGAVDRGLHALEEGGVVKRKTGRNQHAMTVIEVLLRRGVVPLAGQHAVPPAEQHRDSASHERDSASHQWDGTGTAHTPSPADSPDRGLEVLDEEEGAARTGGDPDGPPATLKGRPECKICHGAGWFLEASGVTSDCVCTISKPVSGR